MKIIYLFYYAVALSVLSILFTVYDKGASKNHKHHRIPEATLLLLSMMGGSLAMLSTMLLIRHKTNRSKFMLGIPLIILLQIICFYLCFKIDLL